MSILKISSVILFFITFKIIGQELSDSIKFQKDLDIFKTTLQQNHPNLYRYTPKSKFDSVFDSIENNVTRQTTQLDFFRGLSRIESLIREGHSFVEPSPTLSEKVRTKNIFPFEVLINQDKIFITESRTKPLKYLKGAEIISINNKSNFEILKKIEESTGFKSAFNNSALNNILSLYNNFAFAYYYFVDTSQIFKLTYKLKNEMTTNQVIFEGNNERLENYSFPKLPNESSPPIEFKIYKKEGYATIKIKTFAYWVVSFSIRDYHKTFKEIFSQLNDQNINNLIIDVRDNRGGEELIAAHLLTYLIKDEFEIYKYIKLKSLDFKLINSLPNSQKLEFHSFEYIKTDSCYYKKKGALLKTFYPKKKLHYDGKIFVLSNNRSWSAASSFLSLVKSHKIGTIIGQQSGGAFEDVDGRWRINYTLPHSKIRVSFPAWSMKLKVKGQDPNQGVIPDYIVPIAIDDVLMKNDPTLEFTLDLISKSRKK